MGSDGLSKDVLSEGLSDEGREEADSTSKRKVNAKKKKKHKKQRTSESEAADDKPGKGQAPTYKGGMLAQLRKEFCKGETERLRKEHPELKGKDLLVRLNESWKQHPERMAVIHRMGPAERKRRRLDGPDRPLAEQDAVMAPN